MERMLLTMVFWGGGNFPLENGYYIQVWQCGSHKDVHKIHIQNRKAVHSIINWQEVSTKLKRSAGYKRGAVTALNERVIPRRHVVGQVSKNKE